MRKRAERGQGALEYILVLSVIILAILAASGGIKSVVELKVFPNAKKAITDASTEWKTKGGF